MSFYLFKLQFFYLIFYFLLFNRQFLRSAEMYKSDLKVVPETVQKNVEKMILKRCFLGINLASLDYEPHYWILYVFRICTKIRV